ncbi:MAG: hypothetical protein JW846_06720 [Dehalococcoidia bacterium]|nr:hypothetical protein [Dehalococcoidia bacterium]
MLCNDRLRYTVYKWIDDPEEGSGRERQNRSALPWDRRHAGTAPDTGHPPSIVGFSASDDNLAAFEAFFSGRPTGTEPGTAFVLAQHLAPDNTSLFERTTVEHPGFEHQSPSAPSLPLQTYAGSAAALDSVPAFNLMRNAYASSEIRRLLQRLRRQKPVTTPNSAGCAEQWEQYRGSLQTEIQIADLHRLSYSNLHGRTRMSSCLRRAQLIAGVGSTATTATGNTLRGAFHEAAAFSCQPSASLIFATNAYEPDVAWHTKHESAGDTPFAGFQSRGVPTFDEAGSVLALPLFHNTTVSMAVPMNA